MAFDDKTSGATRFILVQKARLLYRITPERINPEAYLESKFFARTIHLMQARWCLSVREIQRI